MIIFKGIPKESYRLKSMNYITFAESCINCFSAGIPNFTTNKQHFKLFKYIRHGNNQNEQSTHCFRLQSKR
jgi:hypothetical protein